MKKIKVRLKHKSYEIIICSDKINKLGETIALLKIGTDAVIITNPTLKRLFGNRVKASLASSGFNTKFETVPEGEKAKSEKYCLELLNKISQFDGGHRKLFIIALGGGVIGDLAGFVASIYRRGVPYIQIPTTLLAQVDSAIGGKVAIDLKTGKNLVGSFYQPRLVFSDISMLKTLARKDLISGIAEVIKYGIIKSPELFSFLEKNMEKILKQDKKTLFFIVFVCSSIKARVVEKDEKDTKNTRVILNLGHTIGHAIEAASGYSGYNHGHAVALGILSAAAISNQMGFLSKETYLRIRNLIKKAGLPVRLEAVSVKKIMRLQEHDKKFIHGKNRLVLPVSIGKAFVKENIPKKLIEKAVLDIIK